MSTLEVRVNAQTTEDDLRYGAQLTGNIYSVDTTDQSQRDVVLPVGDSVEPKKFEVEPGRYVVEAAMPSGRLLSYEVEVGPGETTTVELDATDSPNPALAWQYIVGNVEGAEVYHSGAAVPVPRSVGARTARPDTVDDVANPATLPGIWCSGRAAGGIDFAAVLSIVDGDPTSAFEQFVQGPWVEKSDDGVVASAESDSAAPLFRFTGHEFGLGTDDVEGRRFLLVRSAVDRFIVTLPMPWFDVRTGDEATVEVLINARQSPFGNPVAVAVRDPTAGAGLGYLANGAFANAALLFGDVEEMLYGKQGNPLGAAAGAYVLVGTHPTQQRMRWDDWIDNLDARFSFMSDGAILRATRLLRTARTQAELDTAKESLLAASRRGLPVFTLGISWLMDGLSEFPEDPHCESALLAIRRLSWRIDMREPFVVMRVGAAQ